MSGAKPLDTTNPPRRRQTRRTMAPTRLSIARCTCLPLFACSLRHALQQALIQRMMRHCVLGFECSIGPHLFAEVVDESDAPVLIVSTSCAQCHDIHLVCCCHVLQTLTRTAELLSRERINRRAWEPTLLVCAPLIPLGVVVVGAPRSVDNIVVFGHCCWPTHGHKAACRCRLQMSTPHRHVRHEVGQSLHQIPRAGGQSWDSSLPPHPLRFGRSPRGRSAPQAVAL